MIRAAVHPLRGTRGNAEDILAALERNVGLSSDPFVELPLAGKPPPRPPEAVVAIVYS